MQELNGKYYHISMPGNAMIDVDLAEEVTTKTLDIDVQPLPSRMVHVVDFEGKDVHRYAMGGRLPTKRPTLAGEVQAIGSRISQNPPWSR